MQCRLFADALNWESNQEAKSVLTSCKAGSLLKTFLLATFLTVKLNVLKNKPPDGFPTLNMPLTGYIRNQLSVQTKQGESKELTS